MQRRPRSALRAAGRLRFRDAESVIRFHEALLFLRAFPPSAGVVRQTEALLSSFHRRVAALRAAGADLSPLDPMEVSGIAGTAIEDSLNFDVSRWLLQRFPGRVDVAWDGYDKQTRLGETLPRFLPLLDDDAYVEADVPYLTWLRSAGGGTGRDLAWLVSRFEAAAAVRTRAGGALRRAGADRPVGSGHAAREPHPELAERPARVLPPGTVASVGARWIWSRR